MSQTTAAGVDEREVLSPAQRHHYAVFGFVRLPGLLLDEVDRIVEAFDSIFDSRPDTMVETRDAIHFGERRLIIPGMVEDNEELGWLLEDPRITGAVASVLGAGAEYMSSDGNLMWCDTGWHCDTFLAPLERRHIKVFLYLDEVTGDSGALRIIPGTSHHTTDFASGLRRDVFDPSTVAERFGVDPSELPSWAVPSSPGDVILGDFRNVHSTFGSQGRLRRLLTLNYRAAVEGEDGGGAVSDVTAELTGFVPTARRVADGA